MTTQLQYINIIIIIIIKTPNGSDKPLQFPWRHDTTLGHICCNQWITDQIIYHVTEHKA